MINEQLLRGLLIYAFASYFTELVIHYLACKIINKKVPWIKICIASLIVDILVAPIAYFGSARILFTNVNPQVLSYLLDMFVVLVNLLSVFLIIERRLVKAVIAGSFAYFIFYQCFMISLIFVPLQYALDSLENQMITIGVLLVFTFFMGKLITKMNTAHYINRCMDSGKYSIIVAASGILLAGSINFILMVVSKLTDLNSILITSSLCMLILFFIFYIFIARNVRHDEYERHQNNIIAQQTSYIQNLEEIQKDIRIYRHDFKNMMAGMYLDVQQGNTESVEKYMQDMFNNFDQNIDQKIQIANQLMNINIIEIKSLVLSKLHEMDMLNIKYNLEVLYPLNSCTMDTHDLLRCMGILMDNAMDYVKQEGGDIDIVITAEKHDTVFLITNSVNGEVDITRIWSNGYSTKGKNRGLGLCSYKDITNRYANVRCSTSCYNGRFYQELTIGDY